MMDPLFLLAGMGFIALVCQWVAWWVRLPAILFLLLSGMLLGPVFGVFKPETLFGEELMSSAIALSVAIILFEGSLGLRFSELRGLGVVVWRLVTVGALVTWIVGAIAARFVADLVWPLAVMFGAVVVVTGPTVIAPMLRTVRPNQNISRILRWEGIVIDPIGAMLAVLVYETIIVGGQMQEGLGHAAVTFLSVVVTGVVFGVLCGYLLATILRRQWVPDYLQTLAALAVVLSGFAISDFFAHESGFLTVTIMGIWLANQEDLHTQEILHFKENLSVLLISGLFLVLAANITSEQLHRIGWPAFVLVMVMQFVARPLSVLVSTSNSPLNVREKILLSWIAPRGIVAAAVAALFALKFAEKNYPDADLLVPLVFSIVVGTVVLQSSTATLLARWLKVMAPPPKGVLFIGANALARGIAKELQKLDVTVKVTDSSWDNIRAARMDNIDTYYGNPASKHAEQALNIEGIGRVFCLSPQRDVNMVSALRFRSEMGRHNVYTISTNDELLTHEKHVASPILRGRSLFGNDVTYSSLISMMNRGASIKSAKLTDAFDFEAYINMPGREAIPLVAVDVAKGNVYPFLASEEPDPHRGWVVIGLVVESAKEAKPGHVTRTGDIGKAEMRAPVRFPRLA